MSCQCEYLRQIAQERAEWTDKLRADNARLRAALETITESDFPYDVAWEALQYYDDLKKAKENYD